MKEPSKEELIEWLDEALECWRNEAISINEKIEGEEIKDQISKLIEEKPKVTKAFVEKWAWKEYKFGTPAQRIILLTKMLIEAGVEVGK